MSTGQSVADGAAARPGHSAKQAATWGTQYAHVPVQFVKTLS